MALAGDPSDGGRVVLRMPGLVEAIVRHARFLHRLDYGQAGPGPAGEPCAGELSIVQPVILQVDRAPAMAPCAVDMDLEPERADLAERGEGERVKDRQTLEHRPRPSLPAAPATAIPRPLSVVAWS